MGVTSCPSSLLSEVGIRRPASEVEKHSWQKGCHMLRGLPHKRLGVIAGEEGVGLMPRSDSREHKMSSPHSDETPMLC